jgi:two-component system chemotaxis response regulator CheY
MVSGPARVLVADDASFMRKLVGDVLSAAGHLVVGQAADALEAVERFAALRPDLVTLDITMPRANGIEALQKILDVDPGARVLMCSALGQERKMLEAARLGAKGFLVKPFTPESLRAAVGDALRT